MKYKTKHKVFVLYFRGAATAKPHFAPSGQRNGSPISSMIKRTCFGVKLRKFLEIKCRNLGLTLSQNLSFFIAVSFDRSGKYIMASSLLP